MLALMAMLEITKNGSHNHQNYTGSTKGFDGEVNPEQYLKPDRQFLWRLYIPRMLSSAVMGSCNGTRREYDEKDLHGRVSRQ